MEILEEIQIEPGTPPRIVRRVLDGVRVFTVIAAIFAIIGCVVSVSVWVRIDQAEGAAQGQLRALSGASAQSAQTLRSVTDASTQGAATVDSATTSLQQVSQTVRDTATTLENTAGVFNFTIPITNMKPLAGVDETFRQEATQLRTVATQIDQTGGSLAKNGDSLRTIGQQVTLVAANMDDLSASLTRFADGPGPSSIPAIAWDIRALLIWGVIFHIMVLGFAISFYILATALRQMTYHAPRGGARDTAGS